ncbi:MAG TPA: transcriptional repressor [Nitrospiria bacterium]
MILSLEQIRQRFRSRGLKFTGPRYAVYQTLASSSKHPSVEDLYKTVRRDYPTLSMNTVYTTLEALKQIGIASEISLWHDKARYDANLRPHHHLVCLGCRKIEDLYDDTLDVLALSPKAKHRYRIMGHRVEFHGYCNDCKDVKKTKTPKRR